MCLSCVTCELNSCHMEPGCLFLNKHRIAAQHPWSFVILKPPKVFELLNLGCYWASFPVGSVFFLSKVLCYKHQT